MLPALQVSSTVRAEATFSLCELACEQQSHSENVASVRRVGFEGLGLEALPLPLPHLKNV